MTKLLMKILLVLVAVALGSPVLGAEGDKKSQEQKKYTAVLSGKEVVPPVDTKATGKAVFSYNDELGGLNYSIDVSKMTNITGAHVHLGKKGENGPAVLSLMEGKPEGEVEGNLVEGVILEVDFIGQLQGKPLQDLVDLFQKKEAYIMIHTEDHPDGEIRGTVQ